MIERMERALLMLAFLIELDDDVHVPMYENFEAELKELKARQGASHEYRFIPPIPHALVGSRTGGMFHRP
jgi:hypothetical protein